MRKSEKLLTEKQLLAALWTMGDRIFPAQIRSLEPTKRASGSDVDAMAEIAWDGIAFTFAVEARVPFNPKAIVDAAQRVILAAKELKVNPLVVTPYLSDQQLRTLESKQVSGIDLCGNCVIVVPERLLIYRTGKPNVYPSGNPIRNVYRGTSSLIARTFLLRPEYETTQQLLDEVATRGGTATLPTVSKVCSSLEDDLIIERKTQGRTTRLSLLQPDKLLSCLVENYEAPAVQKQVTGKSELDEKAFEKLALQWSRDNQERFVRTGTSSSDRYATIAREPIRRYYCTDVSGIIDRLGNDWRETDRFPTIELLETGDPTVYFDARDTTEASPIQVYLELSAGDKRERETAEQIQLLLLSDAKRSRSSK